MTIVKRVNREVRSRTDVLVKAYKNKQDMYRKWYRTLPDIPLELMQDVDEVLKEYHYAYDDLRDIVVEDFNVYTEEEAIEYFGSTKGLIHNTKFPDLYIHIGGIII